LKATLLDGRAIGAEIKAELRLDIVKYVHEQGRPPGLYIVRVGGDAASGLYSKAILRVAEEIGIKATLEQYPTRISTDDLCEKLMSLNCDETIHGIIVQMPLPGHLSQKMVADMINSSKDIDGISPRSAGNLFLGLPSFLPATVAAIMEILDRSRAPLEGKRVVVISRSNIVGKPLAMMLLQKNATVTVSHSRTVDLAGLTLQADVLVAAAGHANMITADMVRPGAIVIDVGINELPVGGIVGDVDFKAVSEVAGAITPTPGGVGPLTNILLLKQCIRAAWQQLQNGEGMLGKVSLF
jgi:methylenetetrahydrofolate dehydrogenase (NADP+)/methenyltetrahydrofolate cyclohydrolase